MEQYQTVKECRKVHAGTRSWIGVMMTLLVALITTTIGAASMSWHASTKSERVDHAVSVLAAESQQQQESTEKMLQLIYDQTQEMGKTQKQILQDLGRR